MSVSALEGVSVCALEGVAVRALEGVPVSDGVPICVAVVELVAPSDAVVEAVTRLVPALVTELVCVQPAVATAAIADCVSAWSYMRTSSMCPAMASPLNQLTLPFQPI